MESEILRCAQDDTEALRPVLRGEADSEAVILKEQSD